MPDLVGEWQGKAQEDFSVAAGLLRRRKVPADIVCFHCQQAVEKWLKALSQRDGIRFSKVHSLVALAAPLHPAYPQLELMGDDLRRLTLYAVIFRYPGSHATKEDAKKAVAAARRVRTAILGIMQRK